LLTSAVPPDSLRFSDLALIEPLLRAVAAEGYETPTPIQKAAIPHVLAGRDVLGCAQTGTGKTAAFALPILQDLATSGPPPRPRHPRVLVLTPTRELATQIGDSFASYGRHTPLRHTVIFGGVGQSQQVAALRAGVDVLVATPGRLLDLMGQRLVNLELVRIFVLDEADRMLDMGFIHDVRRVIERLPTRRQTLLFSATMPLEIQSLAGSILKDPVQVGAGRPVSTAADNIDQSIYFVEKADKRSLLAHLLEDPSITRALVFTRTKHGANRVTEHLRKSRIVAGVIHGNKSQNAREQALADFKAGRARVLVATDIAARGIDIEDISHVINFDLPNIAESYVHRIGRTARAGASGIALSFCDVDEREYLRDIERLVKTRLRVVVDHPYRSAHRPPEPPPTRGAPRLTAPPSPPLRTLPTQHQPPTGNRPPRRRRRRRAPGSAPSGTAV